MALRVLVVIALTLALLGGGETLATDASVSFTRDIAPVLIERCVRCHGDEAAKGDYRLDTFSHLNRPGDSGRVPISTLDPAKSPFLVLLTTDDPDDRMPQKGEPLDSSTVDRIRKWIEQGADFDGPDPEKPLAEFAFEPFAQAPAHYAYPVPVAAVVGIGKGSIAAGGFREITVWNAEGVLEKRIGGVPERILGLVRGPEEGTLLFAGGSPGRSGAAGMVDVRGDSGPRVFLRGSDTLLALAVTRDGSRIAVGGTERGIVVLDGGTFDRLRTLTSHSDWVLDLAFSSDGRYLA
ncbi:MAG: c-type cytochrome domain-containing protein, partial [Limisphaerales bacterium]